MRVAISRFAQMGYCELAAYLELVQGMRPRMREWVVQGAKQHGVSEKMDAARGYEKATPEKLRKEIDRKESAFEVLSERVGVAFEYRGNEYTGRLDKLLKLGEKLLVVDEKFVGKSWQKIFLTS